MSLNGNPSLWELYQTILQRIVANLDHGTGLLPPESLLQHRYLIVEKAGKGGMGAVYLALDTHVGNRSVAVKEMSQAALTDAQRAEATRQFQQEAALLGSLSHLNLPRVLDSFQERGHPYLVMDFIKGETLLQLLTRQGGQPLPVAKVVDYALQLCDVLTYLHEHQPSIIFRDLKPSNVMVTHDGHVYLIDFGIARFFKDGQPGDTNSYGTPGYASPEQYNNAQTSPRSDLYSLGATLHHCLTTQNPRSSARPFTFSPVSQDNPLVPAALEELIKRLVAVDLRQRSASALEVRHTLKGIQSSLGAISLGQGSGSTSLVLVGNLSSSANDPDAKTIFDAFHDAPTPSPAWGRVAQFNLTIPSGALRWTSVVLLLIVSPLITLYEYIRLKTAARGAPKGVAIDRNLADILGRALTTWSPEVWTRRFMALFGTLFMLTLGGSIYISKSLQGSYHILELYLALFLLFVALFASLSKRVRDPIPRSILFLIALAMVVVCFALQALPDVQQELSTLPRINTYNQLLTAGLLLGGLIALIRWPDRLAWMDHLTVFVLAGTCVLLQYSLGSQEFQLIPLLPPAAYTGTSAVLTLILAIIAVISLFRCPFQFTKGDRGLVLFIALIFGFLQYSFGYKELQNLSFFAHNVQSAQTSITSLQQLDLLNVLLTFGPVVVAFISLADLPNGLRWIERVTMPLLAGVCAMLQNYLGNRVQLPLPALGVYPLTLKVLNISMLDQLLTAGLVIAVVLLMLRAIGRQKEPTGRKFHWLDRFAVFGVACACAVLQSSVWEGQAPNVSVVRSSTIDQSMINQQFAISASQVVVFLLYALMSLTFAALIVAATLRLFSFTRRSSKLQHVAVILDNGVAWADRALVICIIVTCILLQWSLGNIEQAIAFLSSLAGRQGGSITWNTDGQGITMVGMLCLVVLLLLFGLIVLYRMFSRCGYALKWVDRFPVVIGIAICLNTLLFWNGRAIRLLPTLSSRVQLSGNVLHLSTVTLNILLISGFIIASAVSLCWSLRPYKRGECDQLLVVLTFASTCVLLQFLGQLFLLIALMVLILCVLVAVQMERVRVRTSM